MIFNWQVAIDFIVLILIYFFVLLPYLRRTRKSLFLLNTIMYIYFVFLLFVTLMPIITSLPAIFSHSYSINWIPFVDYIHGHGDYIRQIILNIIMTIPFGFLVPFSLQKHRFRKTILFTLCLSISIELLQLITANGRACDITDVITNTIGGIIGYGLYVLLKPTMYQLLKQIGFIEEELPIDDKE